jgi:uncharacterized protein YecT (DUF1311 family)
MNTTTLCSEAEAIALAGVSARTLARFCEAGYITTQTSQDGSIRYNRGQIEEIFGLSSAAQSQPEQVIECSLNSTQGSDLGENGCQFEATTSFASQELNQPYQSATHHTQPQQPASETPNFGEENSIRNEVERLRNLLAMQERMLDTKDDEIADLKNQRSWLRERIEKLEEKADRDQILLLSETQTIRSLIAYRETRRSPVKQFLEWIGVAQPTQTLPASSEYQQKSGSTSGSRTIEVAK